MIERLYMQDKQFYGQNRDLVDSEYRSKMNVLWRQYLLDGDRELLLACYKRYRMHISQADMIYSLIIFISRIPGISSVLRGLRHMSHLAHKKYNNSD